MHETVLERLAKRAAIKTDPEEEKLNRETKRALASIKYLQRNLRRKSSSRGGLSSMGALGVYVPDGGLYSRRVVVKSKFQRNYGHGFKERLKTHLAYISRNGAGKEGEKPELFSGDEEHIIIKDVYDKFSESRHHFRFIISPEDSDKIDLKTFTKELMLDIENDLQTKIDWVAAIHYDTNDPHVHMVINGKTKLGDDLFIKQDYITNGIRNKASQIINRKLGLREWINVVRSLYLETTKDRKTSLDSLIEKNVNKKNIDLKKLDENDLDEIPKILLEKRLCYLENHGLAQKTSEQEWQLKEHFTEELKNIYFVKKITQNLSVKLSIDKKNINIVDENSLSSGEIEGLVVKRARINEIDDAEYLVVKSKDGKHHYVELEKYSEKVISQINEKIRIYATQPINGPKRSDGTIFEESMKNGGIYDAMIHEANIKQAKKLPPGIGAKDYVLVHVKRLEVLARRGIVEKESEGTFSIPSNYIEKLENESQISRSKHAPHIKVERLAPAPVLKPKIDREISL